jgi:uncharacterized membrane protein
MNGSRRWPLILVIVGLIGMIIGAIDPLEGSAVILPGIFLVALGAFVGKSRHRRLLGWAFVLVAIGVGAMFAWSAVGGFGGNTGRSYWWASTILPYPAGWIMGIIGAVKLFRERAPVSAQ